MTDASGNRGVNSRPIAASAGIGLRSSHHTALMKSRPMVGWLEAHSENYLSLDGPQATALLHLRESYPLSLHGVGLSLGSTDPIDLAHLGKLRALIDRAQPAFVSEHLSWSSKGGRFANDLLPMPYTAESLAHMIDRVDQVQAALRRSILIENISSYLQFPHSDIDEASFLAHLSRATGCGLLIDINNLYVNERNHGIDARRYIERIPEQAVEELHLGGHTIRSLGEAQILIDAHSTPVCDAVWALYEFAVRRFGPRPALIEWDSDLPTLDVLVSEAQKAQHIIDRLHDLAA